MPHAEETFRRLTIGDPAFLADITDRDRATAVAARLDERTEALIRVAALVAIDAPQTSYHAVVEAAQLAGASLDDLLAALLAVAGSVGSARVTSAAPRIALAAGYDVDADLERADRPDR